MKAYVPRVRLSGDPQARLEALRQYFCDVEVVARPGKSRWRLESLPQNLLQSRLDPNICEGIEWWLKACSKVGNGRRFSSLQSGASFNLALEDSWTLYHWAAWFARQRRLAENIVILHVDDHDDFMSPRVSGVAKNAIDFMTGKGINITQPSTIASAIRSGGIGIGSWIAPFLPLFTTVEIRHLCASASRFGREGWYELELRTEFDTLLRPDLTRPSIALRKITLDSHVLSRHRYFVSDDLSSWLGHLSLQPVLLHIDMDYFCNRFNGNSDYQSLPNRHDKPLEEIKARTQDVMSAIGRHQSDIQDVTVALSPNFFPAEFWSESIEYLGRCLAAEAVTRRA